MGQSRDVKEAKEWPSVANIGLTTRCNGRCTMCFAGKSGIDMSKAMMENLVDQLSVHPIDRFQWVGNLGEPLMNPGLLIRAIDYARSKSPDAAQGIFTNASLLTPELGEQLIRAGLTDITFSVDSLDEKTYEGMRPGLELHEVLNNVLAFTELNDDSGHPVHTRVHAVAIKENFGETTPMRAWWKGKVDEFSWLPCDGRGPTPCLYDESDDYPCWSPFTGIFVNPDGSFLFCCQDGIGKYPVGKFPGQSVKAIWYGKEYGAVRRAHLAGRKRKDLPLCASCHTYY